MSTPPTVDTTNANAVSRDWAEHINNSMHTMGIEVGALKVDVAAMSQEQKNTKQLATEINESVKTLSTALQTKTEKRDVQWGWFIAAVSLSILIVNLMLDPVKANLLRAETDRKEADIYQREFTKTIVETMTQLINKVDDRHTQSLEEHAKEEGHPATLKQVAANHAEFQSHKSMDQQRHDENRSDISHNTASIDSMKDNRNTKQDGLLRDVKISNLLERMNRLEGIRYGERNPIQRHGNLVK